jgi:sortase A
LLKRSDRWLRGLEVGLVLGLGWLLVQAAGALGRLNENAPIARYTPPARPTASPTALLRVVVLPTSAAVVTTWNPTPTLAAPPGYDLLVTSVPVLPIVPPTTGPEQAAAAAQAAHATGLVIPAIGVDAPVVHGVDAASLKLGVGHYDGSVNPGEVGNVVLAGHNDVYGEVFRDLDQLQTGDELTLYSQWGEYRYRVRGWRIVEPSDVSVLDATDTPTLTLISCYPYRIDTQRIIVVADLASF